MITINAIELKIILDGQAGLQLLNVRPADTFSQQCLPGSLRLPLAELKAGAEAMLADKGALIAVYDSDLTCEDSTRAARVLESLGYTNVYDFSSGLKGWRDAGFPLGAPPS
jgi:rhodanese-related sulfurtransferase